MQGCDLVRGDASPLKEDHDVRQSRLPSETPLYIHKAHLRDHHPAPITAILAVFLVVSLTTLRSLELSFLFLAVVVAALVVIVGEDDANPNEAVVVAATKDPCSISRRSNDDNFALAPRADDDDRRERPRVVVIIVVVVLVVAANARGTPTQAAVATTC